MDSEWELTPGDEVNVGRMHLLFVEDMSQLPPLPPEGDGGDASVSIKKRLGQTRFLTPNPEDQPPAPEAESDKGPPSRHSLSRDLALLYRLALDMGSAANYEELVRIVLDGLLEAIPAEVGAILTRKEGRELEVTAHRHRDPSIRSYTRVSEFVTNEVIA